MISTRISRIFSLIILLACMSTPGNVSSGDDHKYLKNTVSNGFKGPHARDIYSWLTNLQKTREIDATVTEEQNEVFATDDVALRFKLAAVLSVHSLKLEEKVLEILDTQGRLPDRDAFGKYHVAVILAGRWRMTKAVPLLLPVATVSLDPDSMDLTGVNSFMCFSNAQALAEIGGPSVISGVLNCIKSSTSKTDVYIYSWILQESLGSEFAPAIVHDVLGKAENTDPPDELATSNLILTERLLSDLGVDITRLLPSELTEELINQDLQQ